ncbi:MAG: HNH endonuclease [Candidatus Bathyarchaeia archaeon]|jgi:5-methylcytosine-specific restriction endonuclease McrA
MSNESKLIIFNVNQNNVPRCIEKKQTGLVAKTPPAYITQGALCLLRQTSRGENPKNYGVVGVYRVEEVLAHDPKADISGWTPKDGWANIVKLQEIFVLPSIFSERFCLPTEVLRHKESKYVDGLLNKDIQGDSRTVREPAASNYILAIETRYPRLAELLGDKRLLTKLVSKRILKREQKKREKLARRLSDRDLATRLEKENHHRVRVISISRTYARSEFVAEFVRRRASGICELCGDEAPFNNKKGEPFLEEHHIEWLSRGGEDTTNNAVALCPNCHRKMHVVKLNEDIEKLLLAAKGH